jgi:hypothetical protein
MITAQPSNVAPRTTALNAAGNTIVTGDYYLPYLPNVALQTAGPQFYMTAFPLQFALITDAAEVSTTQTEMQVLGRNLHAIAVSGTFDATVLIEGSLDGTNWSTLSSLTTTGITQYTGLYQSIRASVSAWTSGTVTVVGMSQRS